MSIFQIKLTILADFNGYKLEKEDCFLYNFLYEDPVFTYILLGDYLFKGPSIENLLDKLRVLHIS